jgi:hypothetical protein
MSTSREAIPLTRLRRRIVLTLLLAVAAIYGVVRGLDLDVATLLDYLLGSVVFVAGTVLAALVVVAAIKLIRRR